MPTVDTLAIGAAPGPTAVAMAAEHARSIPESKLDAILRELARVDAVPSGIPELGPQAFDASRFQIVKRLGAGGFGVVYLARDLATDAEVALKTIPVLRPELIYRLKREFRALADIRHENLVSFYELFAEGDRVYFTMEYVPGTSFLHHVRQSDPTGQRLRGALRQLTAGLSALHTARKLHRDVKPSNVLVTPNERVVLLDFGLATEIREHGAARTVMPSGTPEYMSPEHAHGEPLSEASDWYSVGIMLYQALTGRLPFPRRREQLDEARRAEIPAPRDVSSGAPADLSQLCMSLLALDPAQRAGAREIWDVLGGRRDARVQPRSAANDRTLVGREPELAQLELALERVRAGEPATVLVEGSSGVGKTALVERFLVAAAQRESSIVLRGRCYERERVPYQGIDSLIDDVCRFLDVLDPSAVDGMLPRHLSALVRLFPVLERVGAVSERLDPMGVVSVDSREIRRQAFGALRELLANIARRRVLAMHIDDLQWGDPDTAALLHDVIRPPGAPPMLLILAYRSEDRERSPCLSAMAQETIGAATRVQLAPLPAATAEQLLRSLVHSQHGTLDIARLAGEAGGNPFLIHELARFATLHDATGVSTALDMSSMLRTRMERLPSSAQMLLQTVAVAGQPVTEQIARRAAALSGPAWDEWHLLVTERLVRFAGAPDERYVVAFHDRIRESVLAGLTPDRARDRHVGLATALEAAGVDEPEVLAQHHESAGNTERARILNVEAAAQATRALAFDRAARLLRHAIELAPGDHPRRGDLLAALGEALSNAGRCSEAAAAFLEAAEWGEPGARVQLRRRAGEQLLFAGQIDAGRELIRNDLRAQGFAMARSPGRAIMSVVLRRMFIRLRGLAFRWRDATEVDPHVLSLLRHVYSIATGMSMIDSPTGADIGTRFLLRVLDVGEPHLVARGLVVVAGFGAAEAPLSRRTQELMHRMRNLAQRLEDRPLDGTVALVSSIHGYFAGQWRAALRDADQAHGILREAPGLVWELWTGRAIAIWSLFFLGRWGELEKRVHAGLRDARERGNAYAASVMCAPYGIAAWLGRDQPEEARRTLQDVNAAWSVTGFQLQHFCVLMAESLLQLYVGDGAGAWAHMRERWKSLAGSLTLRFPIVKIELLHMCGCCALAAAGQAQPWGRKQRGLLREAERAARRLDRASLPEAPPFAELLRSGIAARRGNLEEAATRLENAVKELEHVDINIYAAAARRLLARLRGEAPPEFLPGEPIVDPDAIARMLVPGFA